MINVRNKSDFPSFSEGLSLRAPGARRVGQQITHFPSFSEGLSLRVFSGTAEKGAPEHISLPFRRDFH